MADAGWDFENPGFMEDYVYSITDVSDAVSAEEIAIALDDLDCASDTIWPAFDDIMKTLDDRVEFAPEANFEE